MVAPVLEQYTIPIHDGPWTLDEWLALPPTRARVELVDGMLVVSAFEAFPHRRLMARIWRQLADSVPPSMEAMPDCNAALSDSRGLVPDFAVIDAPGFAGLASPARNFVLVGEVSSPSTRRYDRMTKRALYAEAGVRYLMHVDPGDPPEAALLELRGGEYVQISTSRYGRLQMLRPFPLTLDLTGPAPPPAG